MSDNLLLLGLGLRLGGRSGDRSLQSGSVKLIDFRDGDIIVKGTDFRRSVSKSGSE